MGVSGIKGNKRVKVSLSETVDGDDYYYTIDTPISFANSLVIHLNFVTYGNMIFWGV